MEGKFSLLVEAISKASRFLIRDYYELEELQTHAKRNDMFVKKSCTRLMSELSEAAGKYYKKIVFTENDAKTILEGDLASAPDEFLFIEVLDGIGNMTKGLPFFTTTVTTFKKGEDGFIANDVFINVPALNEYYYANRNKGAFKERFTGNSAGKYRIKVSGIKQDAELTAGASMSRFKAACEHSQDVRILGCNSYMYALLASGKLDFVSTDSRLLTKAGFELLLSEAGGKISSDDRTLWGGNLEFMKKLES